MLSIEKYGSMYLAMMGATGNTEIQSRLCQANGVSLVDWNEANAYYLAKMSDVSDMGQTAMALSKYMVTAVPTPIALPEDFTAAQVNIFTNEHMVQMVEFINGSHYVELQKSVKADPNDEFLTNYVQGRVHISVNAQDYSIYGGVTRVILGRNAITFYFDEEGTERMKRNNLSVQFNISNAKYLYLVRTLSIMYQGLNMLQTDPSSIPAKETWNGVDYDLNWVTFQLNDDFMVDIRPDLENLRRSGIYTQHVIVTLKKEDVSMQEEQAKLFDKAGKDLQLAFESDYNTIVSMIIRRHQHDQIFLYTCLSENDFIKRLNEAFCYLPKLPVEINAEDDPLWNNYLECHKDYLEHKS